MIKRTLYFGNPAYLKTKDEQLVIEMQDPANSGTGTGEVKTTPIEDIGIVILDHQQITITQALLAKLLANNTAIITCDNTHHPVGLQLSLDGHTLQSQNLKLRLKHLSRLKSNCGSKLFRQKLPTRLLFYNRNKQKISTCSIYHKM